MSPTPRRYHVNGHADQGFASVPGKSCQNCANTSIILEALFNRIHILEAQLSQVSADKEAVHQTLYRLVDVQAITRQAGIETPSSSETLGQSAGGNSSIGSPGCNLARSRERRTLSNGKNTLLIDLLGPIEQQPVKTLKQSVELSSPNKRYQALLNYESSDEEEEELISVVPMEVLDIGHVRRFADKALDPVAAETKEQSTAAVINGTGELPVAKRTNVYEGTSYGLSNDGDEDGPTVVTPLNTSFSSHNALVNDLLVSNECTVKKPTLPLLVGLEHSRWAPKPTNKESRTPSNCQNVLQETLSPEQRWEKYCDNIAVKDFRRSCDELEVSEATPAEATHINNDEILAQEGQAAKFNRFRYLNVCGLCFNPRNDEQGAYRTVIVSKLPKKCTMTDLLSDIRGGMILDAKMHNTFAITKYKSAMLTFVEGHSAMDLEEHAKQHPLSFAGQSVEVSLVEVPTRPMHSQLERDVRMKHHTRCLHVHNYPRYIAPQHLRRDLRPDVATTIDFVESMAMNADGVLELHFLSVEAAQEAFALLSASKGKYQKCLVNYADDPCAQPWESAEAAKTLSASRLGTDNAELDDSLVGPDKV